MDKTFICTVCPMGCELSATLSKDGKTVSLVSGNSCKRGEAYAKSEAVCPTRTLTSTVLCEDGSLLSVKTEKPILKENIFDCMKLISSVKVKLPVCVGQVIVPEAFGTRIIATQNKGGQKK